MPHTTDNMEAGKLLQGLGLTSVEAATYLALLEIQPASIRKIAAATGINRGTTYDALKRLTTSTLVSVRQQGSREHYRAESPEVILDIIRDKRRNLLDATVRAKALIPNLLARQANTDGQPLVRYYEDDDGVLTILKDVLQTCRDLAVREYCAYSSSSIRQYLYRAFPSFTKQRIAEAIRVKVIAVGEGGAAAEYAERKWIAHQDGDTMSSYTLIYGNKVATISITGSHTPYGVVIEDAGAAAMQRLLFSQLWRRL